MHRLSRRSVAASFIGLSIAASQAAAGGWSVSLGIGLGFGGGCDWGGWVGPVFSVGTTWYGGDCGYPYYRPYYGGGYCGNGGYSGGGYGYPCASNGATNGAVYASSPRPSYEQPAYASAAQESARIAERPRPVAPAAPTETNAARGWRLMESGETGAMEAFGRAVARSEGADAYLGYAICAASAGQNDRAAWAARAALNKDTQVLAKAPMGRGVKGAADAALSRFAGSTPGSDDRRWFTVSVLSALAGDGPGAASAAMRLAGVDLATDNLREAVGGLGAAPTPAAIGSDVGATVAAKADRAAAAEVAAKPASPAAAEHRVTVLPRRDPE